MLAEAAKGPRASNPKTDYYAAPTREMAIGLKLIQHRASYLLGISLTREEAKNEISL